MHPLVQLLLVIIGAGIIAYLINAFAPMDSRFKALFNFVLAVIVLLWFLDTFFGVLGGRFSFHSHVHP